MSGLNKTVCATIISTLLLMSIGTVFKLDQDYSAQALTLLQDSFESGTFGSWSGLALTSGDTASVSKAIPYDGSYSALFQINVSTSGTRKSCVYANVNGTASFYVRGYFYIADGLPLGDNGCRFGLIAFGVGSTILASFRIFRTGGIDKFNIIGYNGSGNYPARSTDVVHPQENQWYCVEFYAKVHTSAGEYRAWINGVEQLSITGVNSAVLGNINTVWWGLPFSIDIQNSVTVYGDSAAIADSYIGPMKRAFGVVGSVASDYAIRNFYWLFGNQSISYDCLSPSEITRFADVDRFDGLVLWTKNAAYNSTAIKQYAQTHIVITDIWDFCNELYPTLASSLQVVSTASVTYSMYWGNFRSGDRAEMRNETGNIDQLTTVLSSGLSTLSNTRIIAQFDSNHVAFFHMNGTRPNSGFYVMDLDATTPETEFAGIWHIFPAVKMVRDFPTGKYARWMADGQQWYDLTWVYNRIDTLISQSGGIATKLIIGRSVEGRDIPAMAIGTGSRYAIIDGSIHGDEKTGAFASIRIAELLLSYYQSNTLWRSRLTELTVIVIPILNPDGFVRTARGNANGVDLNSQFPPDGTPTQPEAFALINLMGNYTPTVYINLHEGYHWYPLDMLCGNYETGEGRTATITAMQQANESFVGLKHYGWFTEQNSNVWIGRVKAICGGGKLGMAIAYASYEYHASCMLMETFMWTHTWEARKNLWALDYYPAVSLSFLASHTQGNTSALVSDIEQNIVDTAANKTYFIQTRNPYDAQGNGYVYSACLNQQTLRMMDDSQTVTQAGPNSGKPTFMNMSIVLFGGPVAHRCTEYYERTGQTPLVFTETAYGQDKWGLMEKDGTAIPNAWINITQWNGHSDVFTIETFVDSSNNFVAIMYGITQYGTLAAGPCFRDTILPNIDSYTQDWYIFRWTDGFNNQPYDGFPQPSEITQVAQGN